MNQIQLAVERALPSDARPFGFIFARRSLVTTSSGMIEIRDRECPDRYANIYYWAEGLRPDEESSELQFCKDSEMRESLAEGFYIRDRRTGLAYSRPVPRTSAEVGLNWQNKNADQKIIFEVMAEIVESHMLVIRGLERTHPDHPESIIAFHEVYPKIVQNKFDLSWESVIDIIRP